MDHDETDEFDVMALLPHLTGLSAVLNRSRLVERAMEEAGVAIDRPATTVLITLHMAGEPLRVGEIATRMQVVGPHVTRLLHDLERRGLVGRIADPNDQRARLIELGPGGREIAERYFRAVFGWINKAVADWPEQDRRVFGRLLERFVGDLTRQLSPGEETP
ncbi:MarR family winged helix-turn-helix transcriptional regulator [Kibdelosporangium phytohabitans]|uniref:MarR family transcriptional regulator n=1 Tax=Kibdelosporangium phytohabitans TaxID=860235 RepID=A0A0N7F3I3_9PSEU|nr:MarR family transcriptional regulator [Kibdelosporangium phytohabitans]ALG08711.1 MarR family transcriptional regulator [Kibdelosporangium phytohabitans]MBE1470178.1 DNA-binding MarR family transcriptional regulator [Kibdelosporangium phytohabitans]